MNKPPTDGIRIAADDLRSFVASIFRKVPIPSEHAELISELLVDTDLRGVVSHGVKQVFRYVRALQEGQYNRLPQVRVLRDNPVTASLSGDGGLGMIVGKRAMQMAIDKARRFGVGIATSTYSGHVGSVGKYARMAMRQDMIGISFGGRNAAPSYDPNRTIRGSIQGSPPMAFCIPSGPDQPYFLLDMATNLPYDEACFVQMQDIFFKRIGLSHVANILSGTLGGQMLPSFDRRHTPYPRADQSGFYMAINIGHFVPLDAFKDDMNHLMAQTRAMKPFPGHEQSWLPGGPNWQWEQDYARDGVPIGADDVQALENLAYELGVEVPWNGSSGTKAAEKN